MAHRRGGRMMVRQGSRRATTWLASTDITISTGLNPATVVLDQSFTGAQTDILGPFTITRTIGSLWVISDTGTADESALCGVGFSVVSEQARAAGAASVPAPFRDEDGQLFFVYATQVASQSVEGTVGNFQQNAFATGRVDFDSKAQRKVESGDAIVIVLENAAASHRLLYWVKFRMLIKVH